MVATSFPPIFPLFRKTVLEYMAAMTALGHGLMEGISGLAPSYFADRYIHDPLILFRIFHYPAMAGPLEDEPPWGVGEHTDYCVR